MLSTDYAAVQDAVAAILQSADVAGLSQLDTLSLALKRTCVRSDAALVTAVDVRAALEAAPERFELVPWHVNGSPLCGVYLLGAGRARIAPPPALSAADAAYAAQLRALLRAEAHLWFL
jgi:hypothetical protein